MPLVHQMLDELKEDSKLAQIKREKARTLKIIQIWQCVSAMEASVILVGQYPYLREVSKTLLHTLLIDPFCMEGNCCS